MNPQMQYAMPTPQDQMALAMQAFNQQMYGMQAQMTQNMMAMQQ